MRRKAKITFLADEGLGIFALRGKGVEGVGCRYILKESEEFVTRKRGVEKGGRKKKNNAVVKSKSFQRFAK